MADGKSRAYIPQRLSDGAFALGIDEEVAKGCFDVVTDVVGDPTGTSFDMTKWHDGDRLPGERLCPRDRRGACRRQVRHRPRVAGPTFNAYGAGMDNPNDTKEYLPISLQYRPYTAKTARDPSLACGSRRLNGESHLSRQERDYRKRVGPRLCHLCSREASC